MDLRNYSGFSPMRNPSLLQSLRSPFTAYADDRKENGAAPGAPATPTPPKPNATKPGLPWQRLVAGAIAGTADVWACHPLDRIKTHLQNNPKLGIVNSTKEILAKGQGTMGGVYALYEGILPMTAEAIVKVGIRYFAFQFFVEQYTHHVLHDIKPSKEKQFFVNLMGGGFAGFVESFAVVIPCELLKVRHMTTSHNQSFSGVLKDVVKNEGIRGLYSGGTATFLRQATNHMVRFPVFYLITDYMKGGDQHKHLHISQNVLAGGIAGTASTLINNPLDTIKTRMQRVGGTGSVGEAVASIYRDGGLKAYWAGCSMRIARVAPGQAITFGVVEWVLRLLG